MEDVKKWLDDEYPDYQEGVLLLSKYTKKRQLVINLQRKINIRKLTYELGKLAKRRIKVVVVEPEKDSQETDDNNEESQKTNALNPEDLSEDHKALYDETVKMYKESRGIHAKLKVMGDSSDEERAPLTARLKELDLKIRANWAVLDGKNKEDSTPKKPIKVDAKRISSNRKYITTARKKLRAGKFTDSRSENVRAELKLRAEEILNAHENITQAVLDDLKQLGVEIDA